MKTFIKLLSLTVGLVLSMQAVAVAKVEITWTNPEKYTDVKDPFGRLDTTKEDAFYNIEKHLNRLAKKLPDGYLLKMDVTDVDLAGEARTSDVRIIRDLFPPRVEFSYKLLDAGNNVMGEGKENIRNLSFLTNSSLRHRHEAFGYEKQLLEDWFKDTFSQLYAKN